MTLSIIDPVLGAVAVPGLPYTNAGAPTSGASGTFAGLASKGALLVDITNATLYQNTGTQASPTWTQLTAVGGSGAYSGTFDGVVGGVSPAAGTFMTFTSTGLQAGSVAATVTAHAGGTQAAAFALTKQKNYISVCATGGDSVRLPASVAGMTVVIFNGGAASAQVYGAGTDTIDGVATATGVPLANGKRAEYICFAAGNWVSAQLGVASA